MFVFVCHDDQIFFFRHIMLTSINIQQFLFPVDAMHCPVDRYFGSRRRFFGSTLWHQNRNRKLIPRSIRWLTFMFDKASLQLHDLAKRLKEAPTKICNMKVASINNRDHLVGRQTKQCGGDILNLVPR